jgi:hypothetical protein
MSREKFMKTYLHLIFFVWFAVILFLIKAGKYKMKDMEILQLFLYCECLF